MIKQIAKLVLTLILGLILDSVANAQAPCEGCDVALVEVYSNADGSVQFLVMVDTVYEDSLPGFVPSSLAGQTIVAGNGAMENSFTFPSDLVLNAPGFVLVGTQGFADLHLVNPDFIVPNGFLFTRNGSIALRPHNWYALTLSYSTLPTDGVKALYPNAWRDGFEYTETAQATNNAGRTYIFPPAEKFTGLWWNAPSGSESGWGIAVDHQGETVFAAWATYDADGSATWFMMPEATHAVAGLNEPWYFFGSPNSYLGLVYRVTGPAFNSVPFDPSAVTATIAGTGGFHFSTNPDDVAFTNGDSSGFWFSNLDGSVYVNKAITRQVFGNPVPACVENGAPGFTLNFQGVWWDPAESGWGLHLTHQGDVVVAIWFTYDATGKPTWLVMAASKTAQKTYEGAIYRTTGPAYNAATFGPSAVTRTRVGTGLLTFADRDNGAFSYSLDAVAQTKNIARLIFADKPTVCN